MKKLYRTFFLFTVLLLISVFLTLPTFAATEAAEPQILMFEVLQTKVKPQNEKI